MSNRGRQHAYAVRRGDGVFYFDAKRGQAIDVDQIEIGGRGKNVIVSKTGQRFVVLDWCDDAAALWKAMKADGRVP